MTFVAALAVADLLDAFAPPSLVTIKWPNDVMLGGREGVAASWSSPASHAIGRPVAGRRHRREPGPCAGRDRAARDRLAAHLRADIADPPSIEAAAALLAEAFAVWLDALGDAGLPAHPRRLDRADRGLDGPCVARLGHETVEGVAEGVAPDGALRLRMADGSLRLISAGDVFFGGRAREAA